MKLRRILGSSLSFVVLVTGVGCGSSSPPAGGTAGTAATSAAVTTPPPPASAEGKRGERGGRGDGKGPGRGGRRGMRGGSIAARILDEADEIELTDEQKPAVEKIQKDARPEGGPGKGDWKEVHAELVAGVKAGKIDAAKIDAKNAALDKSMEGAQAKQAEALNALHALLKPDQRKAVAKAVKEQADKREERADKKAEEKKADEKKDDKKAKADEHAKKKLERLTKQLELDAAQQKKVEAILAKDKDEAPTAAAMDAAREETKKKNDAVLAAFEADTFDAKKLDLNGGAAAGKKGKGGIAGEVAFLSQLLPILKPEQREKLAASMDKPWGMGRMGDRPGGHRFGFFDEPPMMPHGGMMRGPIGEPGAPGTPPGGGAPPPAPAGKELAPEDRAPSAAISLEIAAFRAKRAR